MEILKDISNYITYSNKYLFFLSAFNIFLLIIFSFATVVFRYLFNYSEIWLDELLWHFFGASFLLAAPYAFHLDTHVRVDLFYEKFSTKTKNIINLIGTLLFLIPVTSMIAYFGFYYALQSWDVSETSMNPNGLAWRWFIKGIAPFAYAMLCLQGVAFILNQFSDFFKTEDVRNK